MMKKIYSNPLSGTRIMLKSFEKFMSLLDRKNHRTNAPKCHDCRLEALKERTLLSAVPLSAEEYADLRPIMPTLI